jgi:transcriptional regulator with XRE-family HTH domain
MNDADPVMLHARFLFAASGLTLDELGMKMGYEGDMARKSAWQFLNKTADPRLSTLRKFAVAVGVPVSDLFPEPKKSKAKQRPA